MTDSHEQLPPQLPKSLTPKTYGVVLDSPRVGFEGRSDVSVIAAKMKKMKKSTLALGAEVVSPARDAEAFTAQVPKPPKSAATMPVISVCV
jgi:hypothetical protein